MALRTIRLSWGAVAFVCAVHLYAVTPLPDTYLTFSVDYRLGTRDRDSAYMGGTETTWLVPHKGKLFAGISYWKDSATTVDRKPGARVLVKENAAASWRVDRSLTRKYLRVDAMASLVITRDGRANAVNPSDTLLCLGPSEVGGDREATVWTRTVVCGDNIVDGQLRSYVRIIFSHIDRVTGTQYIYAGAAKGALFRGVYDASAEGKLVWETEPVLAPANGRFHAAAEANGVQYVSTAPGDLDTISYGQLYRRIDGAEPRWEEVYRWEVGAHMKGGLRGLTAVPVTPGSTHEMLCGAREEDGIIETIDPARDHAVSLELDFRTYYRNLWGGLGGGAWLAAYNNMTPWRIPGTDSTVHLIGLWINHPQRTTPPHNGSRFLIRREDGSYANGEVFDYHNPVAEGTELRATRTIAVSPFPEDAGRVLYFGGFDAGGSTEDFHNTAWVYRAEYGGDTQANEGRATRSRATGADPSRSRRLLVAVGRNAGAVCRHHGLESRELQGTVYSLRGEVVHIRAIVPRQVYFTSVAPRAYIITNQPR